MDRILFKDFSEKIKSFKIEDILYYLNRKNVTLFIYYTLLSLTGLVFLFAIGKSNYEIPFATNVMFAWLILIILFPLPESAKTDIKPFNYE